jgi:uncharacterized protein
MSTLILKHREEIEKVCQEQGISYLALFGSHARGDETPESDVDLLVEFKSTKDTGLTHILQTEAKLSQILNKKVDLVPRDSLDKYIAPYIKDDLKTIYA